MSGGMELERVRLPYGCVQLGRAIIDRRKSRTSLLWIESERERVCQEVRQNKVSVKSRVKTKDISLECPLLNLSIARTFMNGEAALKLFGALLRIPCDKERKSCQQERDAKH